MMGISPEMLGMLGVALMQQGQGNRNNNALGMLPLALLNSQMGSQPVQEEPSIPATAMLQQATAPQMSSQEIMDAMKDFNAIQQQTARTPSQQNDVDLNNNFIKKYDNSYVKASTPMAPVANPFSGATPQINPYFQQLKDSAQSAYPNNPTMQQVAMSQALLESGVKPSRLATQSNNYFGIKSPKGTSMPTQEYVNGRPVIQNANFAVNPNMQSSFDQHRNLLSNARYQPVMASQDPVSAFMALQKAGYATDPAYANKLRSVYNRYVQPLYGV